MHDYEQNTNSAIGSGIIKTGTILNLDSNNNLLSGERCKSNFPKKPRSNFFPVQNLKEFR